MATIGQKISQDFISEVAKLDRPSYDDLHDIYLRLSKRIDENINQDLFDYIKMMTPNMTCSNCRKIKELRK